MAYYRRVIGVRGGRAAVRYVYICVGLVVCVVVYNTDRLRR